MAEEASKSQDEKSASALSEATEGKPAEHEEECDPHSGSSGVRSAPLFIADHSTLGSSQITMRDEAQNPMDLSSVENETSRLGMEDTLGSSKDNPDIPKLVNKGKERVLEMTDDSNIQCVPGQSSKIFEGSGTATIDHRVPQTSQSLFSPLPVEPYPMLPPRRTDTLKSMSSQRTRTQFLNHDIDLKEITYLLKTITFNGEERSIVCQTTNGACPILSIANFLSLTSAIELPRRQKQISAVRLTELLAEYLLAQEKDLSILSDLEGLHRGLNVDPQFTGVNRFLEGQEIMTAFGCELLHGWLPSPEDAAYTYLVPNLEMNSSSASQGVAPFESFEAAQIQIISDPEAEVSLRLNEFFLNYPNNMSPFGLDALQRHLEGGEMSILFYNSHFSLLYKHPQADGLYSLVTDSGYLESGNDVVWEDLIVDGASQLYSSDFIPRSVLGESMHQNEYGQLQRKSQDSADEDLILAQKLHQEDFAQHKEADEALAKRLQEAEDAEQRAAEHRARSQRLTEDQRRVEKYNGLTDAHSESGPNREPPETGIKDTSRSQRRPKERKKKDCVVM